jgi:hypothetical protein
LRPLDHDDPNMGYADAPHIVLTVLYYFLACIWHDH